MSVGGRVPVWYSVLAMKLRLRFPTRPGPYATADCVPADCAVLKKPSASARLPSNGKCAMRP